MRRRRRTSALFLKLTEEKTFVEVLIDILYKIKPQDNGAEVSSIRKRVGDGVFFEIGLKTTDKGMHCEALRGLLGEIILVYNLELSGNARS